MKVQLWATEEKPMRLKFFQPDNNACLMFQCGDGELTQYGLPIEKAWSMLALWGDADTLIFSLGNREHFRMSDEDAPARLAKLRAETMGQPVPEAEAA